MAKGGRHGNIESGGATCENVFISWYKTMNVFVPLSDNYVNSAF